MIFTVTLNPAMDKTVVTPHFRTNTVNRIQSVRTDIGGKGINVSKALDELGMSSIAAAFFGGDTGRHCKTLLAQTSIGLLTIPISGETRTNLKIIDPVLHQNTDLNEPGPEISSDLLQQMRSRIADRLHPGDFVILSGSLPPGAPEDLYYQWIRAFHEKGAQVFLDADGEAFRLGLEAIPDAVKPNQDELSRAVGRQLHTQSEVLQAGKSLLARGIRTVLISCGADGAMLLTKATAYSARAPKVDVKSTVGAGDAMLAALAYGMAQNMPQEKILRLAVAIGSASVTVDGTQPPSLTLIQTLQNDIEVKEITV